jgi:hypothetical protein
MTAVRSFYMPQFTLDLDVLRVERFGNSLNS